MDENFSRILAIDYGKKRIGLAISGPLGITTQPLKAIIRSHIDSDLKIITDKINEYEVDRIVIGLPLNMDGSEGFMVKFMRSFANQLKNKCALEIIEIDERLTSFQAGEILKEAEVKGKRKKEKIDSLSAQIILQTYLDSISI